MHYKGLSILVSIALLLCLGAWPVETVKAQNVNNIAYSVGSLAGISADLVYNLIMLPIAPLSLAAVLFTYLPVVDDLIFAVNDFISRILAMPLSFVFSISLIVPLLSFVVGALNGMYKAGRMHILPRFFSLIGTDAIAKAVQSASIERMIPAGRRYNG
jgi:Na+/H+-translocating membrane pyrophosphatase